MTVRPVAREVVDTGVRKLIADHVYDGLPVGLVQAPDEAFELDGEGRPNLRFAIVFPAPTGESLGGPITPEGTVSLGYTVRSHGADRRQAQWVLDEVRRVMVSRSAWGALTFALDLTDRNGRIEHVEHDRYLEGAYGAVTVIESVHQATEEFYVIVSRNET